MMSQVAANPADAVLMVWFFTMEAVAIARTNCLLLSLGLTNAVKVFFCHSEITALRSYSQAHIKLSIDNEEMVRIVRTGYHNIRFAGDFGSVQF